MVSSSKLEVLDLRHFSAAQLRPLLMDEAANWERRLRWDYRPSTELLLGYLDSHVLPGFAAVQRGKILGYTFSVLESSKAVIGDVYAFGEAEQLDNPVCSALLDHLVEMLQNTPGVDRIEAQLMMFPSGALSEQLSSWRFQAVPRLYMLWDFLAGPPPQDQLPNGLRLQAWRPEFYDAAAELIYAAYAGHVDSGINDQYQSLQGSLRFLHNVVRFPGCGTFESDNSWVLQDNSGRFCALLLSSRLRHDVGHVTQLCVAPDARGHGLGRILLRQCAAALKARSGSALSLTVTEANVAALRLYHELGFETLHRFDALVWNAAR